jgi:hypothetical protein
MEQETGLRQFLGDLTARQRARVVRGLSKLPRAERERIRGVIADHAATFTGDEREDPGAVLLQELLEAEDAWVDTLPDAGGPPRLTAEDWRRMFAESFTLGLQQSGWPVEVAKGIADDASRFEGPERSSDDWIAALTAAGASQAMATSVVPQVLRWGRETAAKAKAEAARTTDDNMREWLAENGCPPEMLDAATAKARRGRKWHEVTDAVAPARVLADKRAVEDALRKACPEIARKAEAAASALLALITDGTPARALELRDGLMADLAVAISSALREGASGVILAEVCREHPNATGTPGAWYDTAYAAQELANVIAEGAVLDVPAVAEAARTVKGIAAEARTWDAAVKRQAKRPTKPGADGAVALHGRGLRPAQIKLVLDRYDLRLSPHTSASVRQAIHARRKASKKSR